MSVFDGNYGGYRPMYNPFQNQYQVQPALQYQNPFLNQQNNFQNQYQQTPQTQQPLQQTGMSAPTVHADILQVKDEEEGRKTPVDVGTSKMMITKDESEIFVKSAFANGEYDFIIYRRQPKKNPEPEKPAIDLSDYLTKEEFEKRIAALTFQSAPVKKTARKEAGDE